MSLSYALKSKYIFELYANEDNSITDAVVERMECFEKLLQTVLKKAVKIAMKLVAGPSTNYFKSIYVLTLRKPEKLDGPQMAKHLVQLLEKMENVPEESP